MIGVDRVPSLQKDTTMADLPSGLTVHELQESGAPGVSSLKKWYESVKGGSSAMARAKMHAAAAGQGLRQGGESLLVGGLFGVASVKLQTGLDVKKVPVDAVVGVLGLLGGAALAHEEYGTDLRNAGAAGLSIFSYRKTQDWAAQKARTGGQPVGFETAKSQAASTASGATAHGDFGAEDPIIAAARLL